MSIYTEPFFFEGCFIFSLKEENVKTGRDRERKMFMILVGSQLRCFSRVVVRWVFRAGVTTPSKVGRTNRTACRGCTQRVARITSLD